MGLLFLFLNELIINVYISLDLIYTVVNIYRCNPYEQKVSGVLNNL